MIIKKIQWLLLTILLFALPISVGAAPIDEVKQYVSDYYTGDLKGDLQSAKTIDAIIDLLDPYSAYFTAEEMKQFTNNVNMTTVGIGIVIEPHEKGILISEVLKGGSAEAASIVAGDIITHVDGISIAGMNTNDASAKIVGAENTKVKITLLNANGKVQTKTLTRKVFSVPNTASYILYGNIGYISLYSFSEDAAILVRKEIKNLTKQGATSFIFDLQNNTGGYVTSAEQIIGLFPGAGYAYAYTDTSGHYLIHAQRQAVQFPAGTSVLVNGMSASASEMTAAALKDQEAATLYGETTYGKGSMQSFFVLSDGSYLKLTIAEFFGPSDSKIHQAGIVPNIKTKTALATAHYNALVSQYAHYNELTAFENVPTTKTFTLTLNKAVSTIAENTIELVSLGGQKVETTTTINENKVTITPTEPLQGGGQYMLLIHPKMKGPSASLKKGSYMHITVQ